MSCFKRFSYLFAFVFSLFLSISLSTIITSGNVSALNDVVFNFDSTNSSIPQSLCYDTGSDGKLCGFEYIIVSSNSSFASNGVYCRGSQNNTNFSTYFGTNYNPYSVYKISDFPHLTNFRCWSSVQLSGDQTYTITFTNTNPFGSVPSGSLSITVNGTFDVSSYASVDVDVPPVPGDYHQDLIDIKASIYACAAVLLVLYFFYCIYRMIIRGVKK